MKSFNDLVKKITVLAESDASRDDRAEKAGRKVTKDLEYDMNHRGKDDNKAERAGRKVTKDIEWDEMHEDMEQAKQQKADDLRAAMKNFNPRPAQPAECAICEEDEMMGVEEGFYVMHPKGQSVSYHKDRESAEREAKQLNQRGGGVYKVEQDVKEAAHQVKQIVKGKNGGMIGEIGFDNDAPAGQGPFYMKHFSSGTQMGGFDSEQDAMNELQYYQNLQDKGFAESKGDFDSEVRDLAAILADEWDLPIADFGREEIEYLAMEFQVGLQDIADVLGVEGNFGPVPSDDEMSDEDFTGMRDALDEVSKSQSQARMMAAAAHNPKFAKKVGVSQDVAKEFNRADTGKDWSKLPQHVAETPYTKAKPPYRPGSIDPSTGKVRAAPKGTYAADQATKKKSSSVAESVDYRRMNRLVEGKIMESISVNTSVSTGDPETGAQPMKTLNITATGEDVDMLSQLLGLAGVQSAGEPSDEVAVVAATPIAQSGPEGMVDLSQFDAPAEPCEVCGESECHCEALEENQPDWPSNTETNDDAFMYSGGLNKPKAYKGSTGQTTRAIVGTVSMDESVELERSLWSLYKSVK